MRWWRRCSFCCWDDYGTHHPGCLWAKFLRAGRWSENGILVVLADGSSCIHGPRACDDCISYDTMLAMSS
jgi:hypothetical protein